MDIKPLSPSFLGIYNLSTSDLGCNASYMVNNFLIFLSTVCSSLFPQLTNAAEYLNKDNAQVLIPRTKLPPFSFYFKTFLNLLIYSFQTFNFMFSSKNLSASKIPKYLYLSPSCNDLIILPPGNSIPTDFTTFHFSITNIAHFSIPNSIPIPLLKTRTACTNESNPFSFRLYNFKSSINKR